MATMTYVSLHHHSTFSYGDAYGTVRQHVQRAAELGMKALALTEHGNCSSHVQLEKACVEFGIKPIFGVEGYIAPPQQKRKCHQTILAKNQIGYQNLNRLITQSWRDFYQWPTMHMDNLEAYNEGLVVLSGCADSVLSCTLLGGKSFGDQRLEYTKEQYLNSCRIIEWYQNVFGDSYYIEVQRFPALSRCCVLNPAFEKLSADTGARLAATCDVHYPYGRDNEMQKILHAAHRGSTVSAVEAGWEYSVLLTHPLSDEEMLKDLIDTGLSENAASEAIANTAKIADICNVVLPKAEPIRYPISEADYAPWQMT